MFQTGTKMNEGVEEKMIACKQHTQAVESDFAAAISNLTGIDKKTLEEKGIQFVLEHPKAIGLTPSKLKRLNTLKQFIKLWNETEFLKEDLKFNSSCVAGQYFVNRFALDTDRERMEIAFLNTQNGLITTKVVSIGTINESLVYPREIIKQVLEHDAHSVFLAHNHPGGSLSPSSADIAVTKKIQAALKTIGANLLDHFIIAGNRYYSFSEQGQL